MCCIARAIIRKRKEEKMKYIAKPKLFNNTGMKEFDDAREAVLYLNQVLSDSVVKPELDYVFIAPKASPKQLKHAIEEYVGIGKLICVA
jgi:hypothetical protein